VACMPDIGFITFVMGEASLACGDPN